jgi:hypothetical protein
MAFQDPPTEPADTATLAELDAYAAQMRELIAACQLHPVPVAALRRLNQLRQLRIAEASAKDFPPPAT